MGTPLSGREVLMGLKKGTTWGTPVQVGANEGLLVKSISLGQQFELLPDQPLGTGWDTSTETGRQAVEGDVSGELRFDGQEFVMIALAMGQAGTPAQIGATLAYQHTLQLTDGVNGLFCTVVQKKKSDLVFEFPSNKVLGFTLRGGKRIPSEFSTRLVGNTQNRNGGSGTNNTTTITSVTYRDKRNRVIGDENAYVRINNQSAGALASTDNIYISEFELSFSRPMEGDHLIDQLSYINEPIGVGFPEVTLRLTFPQFTDSAATLWADLGQTPPTAKKIEIFLQGGTAAGAEKYRMLIQIPQAYLSTIEANPTGPGKIPSPLVYRLTQANSAPAGMTGITNPFAIKVVNLRNTDLLA
jgi:hypothetical protein